MATLVRFNLPQSQLSSQVVEVAAELMNKCPQNPDVEVKKALRQAYIKDMVPKYCSFLAKKVMTTWPCSLSDIQSK